MRNKLIITIVSLITLLGGSYFVSAQTIGGTPKWQYIVGDIIKPLSDSWNLRVGALSDNGTKCLQTDNDGDISVASDPCGSGGGGGASALGDLSDVATTTAPLFSLLSLQSNGTYDSIATSTFNINYSDLVSTPASFETQYNSTTTLNGFTNNQANWDTAFGWGDHSTQNYFDKDTDDTGDITEGTNLYYTQARWDTAFNATSTTPGDWLVGANATTTGKLAAEGGNSDQWNTAFSWGDHSSAGYFLSSNFQSSWDTAFNATSTWASYDTNWDRNFNATSTWHAYSSLFDTNLATKDTGDLTEGSNLYYTDARVNDLLNASTTIATYTEFDTEAEFESLLFSVFTPADGALADDDLSDNTTSDLTEGTNLYYTQDRYDAAHIATSTTPGNWTIGGTDIGSTVQSNLLSLASNRLTVNGDLTINSSGGTSDITIEGSETIRVDGSNIYLGDVNNAVGMGTILRTAGTNRLTIDTSGNTILTSANTANGILYANGSGVLSNSSVFAWDGATQTNRVEASDSVLNISNGNNASYSALNFSRASTGSSNVGGAAIRLLSNTSLVSARLEFLQSSSMNFNSTFQNAGFLFSFANSPATAFATTLYSPGATLEVSSGMRINVSNTATVGVTNGSPTVSTSASLTGLFSVSDPIRIINSSEDFVFTINAIDASSITLDSNWTGTTASGLTAFRAGLNKIFRVVSGDPTANQEFFSVDRFGNSIFNEIGKDANFRIEGDTNNNLFFLDASTDRIGIGTSAPEGLLEIQGAEGVASALYLDADDGDDNADTWIIQSETDNDLSFTNHTSVRLKSTSSGLIYGPMMAMNIDASKVITLAADPGYWPEQDADTGWNMPASGSIIGFTGSGDYTFLMSTSLTNCTLDLLVDGSSVLNVSMSASTLANKEVSTGFQNPGTDTFTAGQELTFQLTPVNGAGFDQCRYEDSQMILFVMFTP